VPLFVFVDTIGTAVRNRNIKMEKREKNNGLIFTAFSNIYYTSFFTIFSQKITFRFEVNFLDII